MSLGSNTIFDFVIADCYGPGMLKEFIPPAVFKMDGFRDFRYCVERRGEHLIFEYIELEDVRLFPGARIRIQRLSDDVYLNILRHGC